LSANVLGGAPSAAAIQPAHCTRRSAGSASTCAAGSGATPRSAASMARHQSTHESPASGSGWVSSAIDRAAVAIAEASPGRASATGAVRMSAPLPAVRPDRSWSARAAARSRVAGEPDRSSASRSTRAVWMPTSAGRPAYQSSNRSATASRPASVVRSASSAAWATQIASCVSSLHSPGS
jgi:hypothetical protein